MAFPFERLPAELRNHHRLARARSQSAVRMALRSTDSEERGMPNARAPVHGGVLARKHGVAVQVHAIADVPPEEADHHHPARGLAALE